VSHPQPGNVITVFRSRLQPEMADEYAAMAADMLELAGGMPGFVSLDRFTAEDGERLSVVVFESAETEAAWREHPRHIEAQALGRDQFFSEYSIAVCECLRSHTNR
jgi:heme-degrading monooxygenase HmoA